MTFNWLDFLELGNSLLTSGKGPPIDESKLRAAIGRMYYAAFGELRHHYVNVERVRFSYSFEDHDILVREIDDKKSPRLAKDFTRLKNTRNMADYDNHLPGDVVKMAEGQLSRTKHILTKHGLLAS
jgi:hypothetical protein